MFLLAVMAMMTLAVQADEEEFVVTSGDFKVVMQPGKIGRVEVDFTKAKVGNLSTMEITDQSFIDYLEANDQKVFKKWSEYQEEGEETFMDRWNDAKKKVIKLTKKGTPDYIIKINATRLIQAIRVQPPGVGTNVTAVLSSLVHWRFLMPQAAACAR